MKILTESFKSDVDVNIFNTRLDVITMEGKTRVKKLDKLEIDLFFDSNKIFQKKWISKY